MCCAGGLLRLAVTCWPLLVSSEQGYLSRPVLCLQIHTCCISGAERREYKQKPLNFGIFVGSVQSTHSAVRIVGLPPSKDERDVFLLFVFL